MTYELGIIGAGNMAEAIARGIISSKSLTPSQMIASDVNAARRDLFQDQISIACVETALEAAKQSKRILLSVKPRQMAEVLRSIKAVVPSTTVVISIAAGTSTAVIEKHLGDAGHRVVRAMPNTPMLVGEGMVALAPGQHATAEDLAFARKLFESAARVIEVVEDQMDAVTAVSGSGPAYFFYLVEQMIAAGVSVGLSPEQAATLAKQTALGAAKMLVTSQDSPAELRRKVTSPGGTTHAAITHMQEKHVDTAIIEAIQAADRRGKELGR